MYRPNLTTIVDVDTEIDAMATYLATRWEHLGDVATLLRAVYAAVLHDAPLWFHEAPLYDLTAARRQRREQLLGACRTTPAGEPSFKPASYDAPCQLLAYLPLNARLVKECAMGIHGGWDFERITRRAYHALADGHPWLASARPQGWEALRRDYTDYAGQTEYCEHQHYEDEAAFEGIDSAMEGAAGFTWRTALPYVMYDEMGQGRTAPYVLVSSAYAHFLAVSSHNNTVALLAALAALDLQETVPQPVFTLDATPTGNALADTLLELTRADLGSAEEMRQRYEEALATLAARARMSEQARAAHKAEAAGRVAERLKSLRLNGPDLEADTHAEQRKARCVARLRELAQLPDAK